MANLDMLIKENVNEIVGEEKKNNNKNKNNNNNIT